ncbi:MAG TPA: hypothetical protein VGR35_05900 [Tepidisphaeraceae bacterium]|nr:hypothetical protein [Tepidisphaeraceae bacterium]
MPLDPRDYKLELSSNAPEQGAPVVASSARPFIGVRFACCDVYVRIYRSPDGKRYRGHCPRCAKPVNFVVGAGGTDARTFLVE